MTEKLKSFEIFKDGIYTVKSNNPIVVGDLIELTTAEFDFDVIDGTFTDCVLTYQVNVEILEEDLTGYIPAQSTNGGAYGYATAVVQEVEMI